MSSPTRSWAQTTAITLTIVAVIVAVAPKIVASYWPDEAIDEFECECAELEQIVVETDWLMNGSEPSSVFAVRNYTGSFRIVAKYDLVTDPIVFDTIADRLVAAGTAYRIRPYGPTEVDVTGAQNNISVYLSARDTGQPTVSVEIQSTGPEVTSTELGLLQDLASAFSEASP